MERCDVAVEERLGAELAVDGSVGRDGATDDGALREDEVVVEVNGLGKDADDRGADVQVRGASDADAERNSGSEGGVRRRRTLG